MASGPRREGPGLPLLKAGALFYVGVLMLLPLGALAVKGAGAGPAGFLAILLEATTLNALWLSVWTALLVTLVNGFFGLVTAWALVRYPLPGKRWLNALIDIPFAIPTLVTGLLIVTLFGPSTGLGLFLSRHGMEVAYARPAIILCLLFITFPFVVRALEPVIKELDPAEEEAAQTLGAGKWTIFTRISLPRIAPSLGSGMAQAFARAVAEFGSIAIASGNIPNETLTASMHIYGEIEGGRPVAASVICLVLLALSVGLVLLTRYLNHLAGVRNG